MRVEQEIAGNLQAAHETIAAAAGRASREPGSVTLVAISKSQPDERIAAALTALSAQWESLYPQLLGVRLRNAHTVFHKTIPGHA